MSLASAYETCRRLHAAHGRSYYLATRLLPSYKRPSVHALYAFARWCDEIVDDLSSTLTAEEKAQALEEFGRSALDASNQHDVAVALRDTMARWEIPDGHVHAFLRSMRMDLTTTSYKTFDDLLDYTHGSAAVVGLQMLPVLEAVVPLEVAAPYAVDLGIAFQLTNFLRDVGEDLRRDRVYLPQEDMDAFGVTVEQLQAGVVDARFRRLMAFEVARTRELYRTAAVGIRLLHPSSRRCNSLAHHLSGGILDAIERADYQVLDRRVRVGTLRRAGMLLRA
jgi:phytoene synthase